MAGTTVGTVKQALVTMLEQATTIGVAGVQVTYGFAARDVEAESIVVGNIDWDDEQFAALGARKRDEFYRVGIFVFVTKPGWSQKETTERGLALFAAIEAELIADPTIGGTVIVAESDPRQVVELPTTEGTSVMIEGEVRVRARK